MVQGAILALIVANLALFVASTDPSWSASSETAFAWIEGCSVIIFTFEYVARVWSIVEANKYAHPLWGRIKFMTKAVSLIDAVAILPWFIGLFVEALTPHDVPITTPIRIFRVLRLLKTEQYGQAFASVKRVVWHNREILSVGLLLSGILLFATATLLWAAEHKDNPGDFGSIPKTLFLAVLMLTGQGIDYSGKNYSTLTLIIIAVTAVVSVAFFAIPAAMLAWAFESEAERLVAVRRERAKAKRRAVELGMTYVEPITDSDSFSSDSSGMLSSSEDGSPEIFALFDDPTSPGLDAAHLGLVLRTFGYDFDAETLEDMLGDVDPFRTGIITYPRLLTLLARRRLRRIQDLGPAAGDEPWRTGGRFSPEDGSRSSLQPLTDVSHAIAVLKALSPADRLQALAAVAAP
ncbi:ion transporter [Thecamonas trahens ATCC 50062]|uniref:Ion transporter n=1 Tax=Thecamonas trahens ATCC 50062 TaxID=461836 RepID=A0A0L0DWN1_THETB|nr:ion transporter [Thecamonas trahens ATCC 50062]KNC55943.1 ion transporter [Thecamonas trahens ATCC 50062]|eukprot:XP_013752715.1 ion transporter [Thecamonas trahens ATCC 50062]